MTAIKLTPESLTYDCQKFYNAADEINRINNEIARLVSSLDWEVRSRGSVENMIVRAAADGSNLASGVESLAQYLKTAANLFQEADANGKTSIEDMTCKMPFTYAKAPGFVAASLLAALFAGGSQCIATELGWLKKIMGIGNTADSLSSQNIAGNVAANNSAESVTATDETQTNNSIDWAAAAKEKERLADFNSVNYAGQSRFEAGECTWYCYGRAQEKLGITIDVPPRGYGDAKNWLNPDYVKNFQISHDVNAIRANSIAVSNIGSHGHVMFIEEVIGDKVYFSEANWDIVDDGVVGAKDGIIKYLNVSDFINQRSIEGYVYLQ